ncbi:MAG: complex I subunit 1/NuoH family protein [Microthrixaceae bacterium]
MTHALLGLELAYWQQTIIRVLAGVTAILLLTGGVVYLYLFKFVSFMQSRLGPMEAGPYGSLQLLAEVGKWLQKEDLFTENSDRFIFGLAPAIVLASTFLMFVVIPAGPNAVVADLGTGIYYVLAMSSLSVLGILIAGWASANKYALMGALRAGGQLIAYELPLVLAVIGVVICAGSLNLQDIVAAQSGGEIFGWSGIGNPYVLTQFVAFAIFMIAVQAELAQTPFDMPVAESELVAGYMVEYTGIRFLVYFISEFATAVGFAAVASTLFLGGWALPASWGISDGAMHVIGPIVIATKAVLLVGVVFWTRFSFPRFREDQLQRLAWKFLIPIALANILVTAVLKVAF